jgi:hypothetical protein
MSNVSQRVKLLVAGTLLALTALAAGLTMSVVFSAQAQEASVNGKVSEWASLPAQANADNGDDDIEFNINFADLPDMDQMLANMPDITEFMANGPVTLQVAGPLGGADAPEGQGVITKIDGNKLTLNNRRTVNVNDQTKYGDAKGDLKLSDFKVDDRVFVVGTVESDKSLTARWVLRLSVLPAVEAGKITSVTAGSNQFKFTVGKNNDEWTATVTSSTQINKNGKTAAIADLAKDDNVVVVGKADKNAKTIEAQRVEVRPARPANGNPPGRPNNATGGKVKSVDVNGNSLVVTTKVNGNDTDVKVTVDSNTRFAGNNLKSLGDLKADDQVFVAGDKQSDGSIKATVISRAPAGRGPAGGGFQFGGPQGGFKGRGGQPGNSANPSPTPNM